MGKILTGDQLRRALKKLSELQRQFGQPEYPFDPERALDALQAVSEGRFEGDTFTRVLDYTGGSGLIERLKAEGNYDWSKDVINSKRYPLSGAGEVDVRFRIMHGANLRRSDDCVYRADVEAVFRFLGMRCPWSEEALLVPAKDQQIGRGTATAAHPLVAFIKDSGDAFIVKGYGVGRRLDFYSGDDGWVPDCGFLGVCE